MVNFLIVVVDRFHKVVWGNYGMGNETKPSGIIVGGTDSGAIHIYDAAKLLNNEEASISVIEKVRKMYREIQY